MGIVVVSVIVAPEPEQVPSTIAKEIILSTPKDSYKVVPYEKENTLHDERDAFIEKVKQTYVPQVVLEPKTNVSDPHTSPIVNEDQIYKQEIPIIVPDNIPASTTITATGTPYGNLSF